MKKVTSRISLFSLAIFFSLSTTSLTACGIIGQCSDTKCIQEKIEEGEAAIYELESYRNTNLQPLYDQYSAEYDDYIRELIYDVSKLEISSHEELLENCNQYYQTCNIFERAAILKHSMKWLDSKINKINFNINELDQNVWKSKRKIELSELSTSSEESNQIKELIAATEILLKEDTTPPEAQDIAKIEQEIFNNIINRNFSR